MTTTEETATEELTSEQARRNEHIARYLDSLVELHAYLTGHPDFVPSYGVEVTRFTHTAEELAEWLHKLGSFEKIDSDYISGGILKIGLHRVRVQTDKGNTCKKIPTGETKVVAVEADPLVALPEGARNARTITKVIYDLDEEQTTWSCPDSLLDPEPSDG